MTPACYEQWPSTKPPTHVFSKISILPEDLLEVTYQDGRKRLWEGLGRAKPVVDPVTDGEGRLVCVPKAPPYGGKPPIEVSEPLETVSAISPDLVLAGTVWP